MSAQTPQAPPVFQGSIDVSQFDVSVLDARRNVVRGLSAEDFTATIDGKPAKIAAVTPVELPLPSPRPATAWLRDVPSDVVTNSNDTRRMVVIVLDDAQTGQVANMPLPGAGPQMIGDTGIPVTGSKDPWILKAGKQIARDVVERLGPNDLAAVVFTYLGRAQNFTADRSKLLRAIDSYTLQGGAAAGQPLGCTLRGRAGCTVDTLERVIEALPTNPPMRKAIVFISQGGRIPGFSAFDSPKPGDTSELREPAGPGLADIQRLFQLLQRANAAVYVYSPGGLQVGRSPFTEALRSFAEVTGGRAVVDSNAPWEGVPAMFEETSSYYFVGIETPMLDGRFHRVKISVNRPGLEVRTRTGFVAPRPDGSVGLRPKNGSVRTPLEAAMEQGFPKSGLPLTAAVTSRRVPGRNEAELRLVVGIPTASPTEQPWTLTVRSAAFETGLYKERAFEHGRMPMDPAAAPTAEVRASLKLEPGRYEVRIGGEGDGRTGSVFLDVELPNFNKTPLWISPLGVTRAPATSVDAPLTVRRTFADAEHARVLAQIARRDRGTSAGARVEFTLTNEQARVVFTRTITLDTVAFGKDGTADIDIELPLASLDAGEFLATMKVTSTEHVAQSLLRFRRE